MTDSQRQHLGRVSDGRGMRVAALDRKRASDDGSAAVSPMRLLARYRALKRLTVETAAATLRGLHDAGVLEVAYGGGEPFAFRGFADLVAQTGPKRVA